MNPQQYFKQARLIPRKVFFNGDTALERGMGLVYDRTVTGSGTGEAATNPWECRDSYVCLPTRAKNWYFAGVVARDYLAKVGGQLIEIYEPGSVCLCAVGSKNPTIGDTLLCLSASAGDAGRFGLAGFPGRGSIQPLQTIAAAMLESDLTGASALDTTGKILTDSAATFVTAGVAAGDRVYIVSGEDDGTDAWIAGCYTVASVTSETALVLTEAASTTGGTMQVSYYVMSGNQLVLAHLLEGPGESGCHYWLSPKTGTAVPGMTCGMNYIGGGYSLASAHSTHTVAASTRGLGSRLGFYCKGAIGGSYDYVVTVAGLQARVTDIVTDGQTADGNPMALASAAFDAAEEVLYLAWWGAWIEQYHGACTIAAT